MTHRGVARTLCPVLALALAMACEQGDGRPASEPQPAMMEPNALTLSRAEAASDQAESDESATELAESEADFSQTESLDPVAPTASATTGAGPERWLDHVAELEPVGAEADELRKLAILHPNPEVRKSALEELADANHELAFKSLVISLEDDDLEVVHTAIEELEFLDDRAAVDPLDRLARSHADEQVRQAALEAIEFLE